MDDASRPRLDDSVYAESFSRNLGILSEQEQDRLAASTVLVVGTGGIGGNVVSILARMGVGRFHLVDPDSFELANINRQFGAAVGTVGRRKVEVVAEAVREINPSVQISTWTRPFANDIAEEVFAGADLAVDAIDFYAIADHLTFHQVARNKGRYVLMGSPVGFSACLQVFDPEGMSLADYCGISEKMDPVEMQLRYACGIVPRLAHLSYYDVSKQTSRTDFLKRKGPSLASACAIAAALVATEAVMLLLSRRKPRAIPHTLQHDPVMYRNEAVYIDGGMPAYDPSDVIDAIEDRSSLVVNIFDHFYRKVRAATLDLRDGGNLCYRVEGKGRPVILIPPVGGDTSFWTRQGPALAAHHRVVAIDNRGIGRSTSLPEGFTIQDMAADVVEMIRHLDLSDVTLVGCALGGLIALETALACPGRVDRVSVIAAYTAADDTIAETTARWRALARTGGMDVVFDDSLAWLFAPDYRESHADELYKLKTFYRVNRQHAEDFCRQTMVGTAYRPSASLSLITCPVQIVQGTADRLVSPVHGHSLQAAIPNSRLVKLAGAGHFLNWERAQEYNAVLLAFLDKASSEK